MKKRYNSKQLKIIKRNYAIRAQREDRENIFSTLLNIPGAIGVTIILFTSLYFATKFLLFLIGSILLGIIEIKLFYDAIIRESKRISKHYF